MARSDSPTKADLYGTIHRRRDVRGQFTGGSVAPSVLDRVLEAAHAAPSVGLSQPWDFVVVDAVDIRKAFYDHVQAERAAYQATLEPERADLFRSIKIDGVLESTLSIVVTYDPARGQPAVLGRHAIDDAGLYSTCLAIQNLWLAATAEGLGVGWVSFYREDFVVRLLGIPAPVRPIAWLCLGPVSHFEDRPDLERHSWAQRRPLEATIHRNHW
jgi:5,6-dimethylbenzimidazole synthase